MNLKDKESVKVDSLSLTINSYKQSNKNKIGPYIVVNNEAKLYQEAYKYGYNDGFANGSELGYEVGYNEAIRNNGKVADLENSVLIYENSFKVLIGLSASALLIGFIYISFSKKKKTKKK